MNQNNKRGERMKEIENMGFSKVILLSTKKPLVRVNPKSRTIVFNVEAMEKARDNKVMFYESKDRTAIALHFCTEKDALAFAKTNKKQRVHQIINRQATQLISKVYQKEYEEFPQEPKAVCFELIEIKNCPDTYRLVPTRLKNMKNMEYY